MDAALLIFLALFAGALAAAVLRLGFGFRGTDFLFLLMALLPAVWMSRLNQYSVTFGGSPFFLLWWVLGFLSLVLLWFPNGQTRGLLRVPFRKLSVVLVALFGFFTISNAANAETDGDVIVGIHASCAHLSAVVAAWLTVRCCRINDARIPQIVLALLIVGAGVAALSVLSALMPGMFRSIVATEKTVLETGRGFSPIGGPAATAMTLLMAYCLACGQLLGGRRRLLSAGILGLCFLGMLTTLARAAVLSFAISNLYLFRGLWRGFGRRTLVLAIVTAVVLVPAGIWLGRVYSLERLISDVPGQAAGRSVAARSMSMKAAFHFGATHPWLGGGWGLVYPFARDDPLGQGRVQLVYIDGYPSLTKPHTLFGLVFAEAGVPGLFLLLLYFWGMWRCLSPPDVAASAYGYGVVQGFRAGFLSFMAMSVVQDTLITTTKLALYFYLFAIMGMAVSAHYRMERSGTAEGFLIPVSEAGRRRRWPVGQS